MSGPTLSEKQLAVYNFLVKSLAGGIPPTVREICQETKIKSTSTVHAILNWLEDSGELVIVKVGEENGEEYYYEIEDDDEYDFVADAFIERLEDFYEISQDE